MMMVFKDITTFCGNGVKLVVWQIGERATRDTKRVVELIVRIVHLIYSEHGLQATFIKGLVVGHKRQSLNQRLYLCPHFRKDRSIVSVFMTEAMNLTAPIVIVVGLGLDDIPMQDGRGEETSSTTSIILPGCLFSEYDRPSVSETRGWRWCDGNHCLQSGCHRDRRDRICP